VLLLNDRKLDYLRRDFVPSPVIIKYGARIAGGAVILPGVTIGVNAVIGAGAVVTRNIPDFMTAWGNPAQITRRVPEDENI